MGMGRWVSGAVGASVIGGLLLAQGAQAATKQFLTIYGEDRAGKWALENTSVSVVEDTAGGIGGIQVISEEGTIKEYYPIDTLRTMSSSPVKYAGFTVMLLDGKKLTRQGGTLTIFFVHNAMPFVSKTYGSVTMEIEREGNAWVASANEKTGRRRVKQLFLTLNTSPLVGVVGVKAAGFR